MKLSKKLMTILSLFVFALAISIPIAVSAEPGATMAPVPNANVLTSGTSAATPAPRATAAEPAPGPHPEIRDAIRLLRDAQDHLRHGAHDFGGHRVKAMEHIDQALTELNEALNYDKH
jgi:hypothetical protein